ncbi:sensor histidine kinase [Oryzifoliimicrobium ureilyticus]|uniref:sensor histidine kinase n=1 Tax=Oryzifoliimicrobium ureilyticus TaxID=3113724 RepID=UPI00307659AD
MTTTNRSFIHSTMIMLAMGGLLLIGIVAASLFLTQQNSSASDSIAQLRRLRSSASDFLLALQEAETGQRGYLLTLDPIYRTPYDKSVARLSEQQKRFNEALAPYPEYVESLGNLDGVIKAKLDEMARTVSLAEKGSSTEALSIVRNDTGNALMDETRGRISKMIAAIDDRLRLKIAAQLQTAQSLQWVSIGGAVAIVAVMGGAILIIFHHVRDLSAAQREVEALNQDLEQRVNERTEDLMRANQEVQRFAYIVTHDLRAPLVNIMGFLSELETGVKSVTTFVHAQPGGLSDSEVKDAQLAVEEDLPEAISFIRSSTKKMDALINAILKISRDGRRKLVPERIDLKALVESTVANVHHQIVEAEGHVAIDIKVSRLYSDRFSLDQILSNLIDNAVKYRAADRPLSISIAAKPIGMGRVRVDVTDNGRGIAASDMERVFELFRRAGTQDKAGEGIGLAYVRSLTRNLGGEVTVSSTEGKGSTFTLELPADLGAILKDRSE